MPNNLKDDEVIVRTIEDMDRTLDMHPIPLAVDTYDKLRLASYNENEALKLTEVICSAYMKKKEIQIISEGIDRILDYLR